jgi:hypothetical protein
VKGRNSKEIGVAPDLGDNTVRNHVISITKSSKSRIVQRLLRLRCNEGSLRIEIGQAKAPSVLQVAELGLPANAIFPSRICDASNNPLTVRTNEIEQVRPAVLHLAIHQKLERSPYHRQIVIDPY